MELQELKNVWDQYDNKIDRQIKMDFNSFKKISLEKASLLLIHLKIGAIIELIINILFLSPMITFTIRNLIEAKFIVPAVLLISFTAFNILWSIYSIIFLSTLNYQAPIAVIQKKLATYNYRIFTGRVNYYML